MNNPKSSERKPPYFLSKAARRRSLALYLILALAPATWTYWYGHKTARFMNEVDRGIFNSLHAASIEKVGCNKKEDLKRLAAIAENSFRWDDTSYAWEHWPDIESIARDTLRWAYFWDIPIFSRSIASWRAGQYQDRIYHLKSVTSLRRGHFDEIEAIDSRRICEQDDAELREIEEEYAEVLTKYQNARPFLEIFYKIWWIATIWAIYAFIAKFPQDWRVDKARRHARDTGKELDESPFIAFQEQLDAEHEALVTGRSPKGQRRVRWAKYILYSAPFYFALTQASQALLEQYGETTYLPWHVPVRQEQSFALFQGKPPCHFDRELFEYTSATAEKMLHEGLEKKHGSIAFWSFLEGLPIPPIAQGFEHVADLQANAKRIAALRLDESMTCDEVDRLVRQRVTGYSFPEAWHDTRLFYDIWGTLIFYALWIVGRWRYARYKASAAEVIRPQNDGT